MSNTIQPGYGTQTYSAPTKAREAKQTGTQGNGFLDMAAQASRGRTDTLCTCVFAACGGECGVMGWIKTTKERQRERSFELEDREHEEQRQKEMEANLNE